MNVFTTLTIYKSMVAIKERIIRDQILMNDPLKVVYQDRYMILTVDQMKNHGIKGKEMYGFDYKLIYFLWSPVEEPKPTPEVEQMALL